MSQLARAWGLLEWHLRPRLALGFGELNGQSVRQAIVEQLIERLEITRIVEAGTFRGTTTEYFARFGLPVLTVEVNPRFYYYARRRLRRFRNVSLFLGDAPGFLEEQVRHGLDQGRTLFYLDDHWHERLPLADDLRVIFSRIPQHVVMVDDFEVPGDSGYLFDDYGPGRRLSMSYLAEHDLPQPHAFFPSAPSSEETGCRRGMVILTTESAAAERLERFESLRPFDSAARRGTVRVGDKLGR